MIILIVVLGILVLLLVSYIVILQRQLRSINRQLVVRLAGDRRQPVSLELINHELNHLTENINKCLKAEETLHLTSIREEKKFKEMIANISHDLRTPLTAIKGYQQLMEGDTLSEEQRKKLQIARRHADELGILIERFFEYSYLLNVEPQLKLEKVNLTNMAAECIAASIPAFENRGIVVHFEDTEPVFAFADREMVMRILQNLIHNCLEHSAGDIDVQVKANRHAVLSFANRAEDAADIDLKCLFDRFYTTDKARSRTTGLGLAIVKLLTEQMNGEVEADLKRERLEIRVKLPIYMEMQK